LFTGIVECVGTIEDAKAVSGGRRLRISCSALAGRLEPGASLSVSGVCLTVAAASGPAIEFDVIAETLSKTTLGAKRAGDQVNLERSLRVGDRLDGHFVQGHIDGAGMVTAVRASTREHVLWLRPEPALARYMIPKGSVAVDGVSLTIAECERDQFSVALIPTTMGRTTLSSLAVGHAVNIESDILVHTIAHLLSHGSRAGDRLLELLAGPGVV